MRHIELPGVGYGDCTVLLGDRSLLMVDCGSMNNKLRNPEMEMTGVFSFIQNRYSPIRDRLFLLTHYHRDHLCGFQQIIKRDPRYFTKVFLPFIPCDENGCNPLLRLSLYAYAMATPQSDISQVNTACVTLPIKLAEAIGYGNISFLKKGDGFVFDGQVYSILNPAPTECYPSALYEALEKLAEIYPGLSPLMDEFCKLYMEFQYSPEEKIKEKLKELCDKVKDNAPTESHSIFADQSFLRELSVAVNNSSVVFHNASPHSGRDSILMTGDISADKFEELFDEFHSTYFAVKAPHHGTASGYSQKLQELEPEHILIHNDEYKKELSIARSYAELECIRHCTGKLSCEYYTEYGGCCNRLTQCYNFARRPELAFRCPDIHRRSRLPGCRIYVVTPAGGRSCFCD